MITFITDGLVDSFIDSFHVLGVPTAGLEMGKRGE